MRLPTIQNPLTWLLAFSLLFTVIPGFAEQPLSKPEAHEKLSLDPAMVMKPWKGDLDGMLKRGYIRVLTVNNKLFYFHDKGTQRGITYDMLHLFEQELNKQLKQQGKLRQKRLKVQVVFIPISRGDLLQALADGKGDIAAANLTNTPERQMLVDFSSPIYPNVSELVVSGPASPDVKTVDDLSGKEVFVRKSSSYYASLVALNQRFVAQEKPGVIIKIAPEALEDGDLVEMVNAGLVPLIIVDKHKADIWKQVFPKIKVHDSVTVRTGGNIAWAIRKGSPQLKASLDDFVTRHGKGTASGNVIFLRYLRTAKYVKDAASEAERKKFLALVQFFQKYGNQYDVDWLLMTAQGYQESQLNQNVRSPAGAIGVMQVMPATGKEMKVGNIAQVEPNIHAGVKYMRFMIDRFYEKERMTKLDKGLFAFASYNAGPARIRQLRREAARRGLDPNVWFGNVELVAAERIGRETVTYVSNIYKYYIAYRLIQESQQAREKAAQQFKNKN